MFFQRVLKGIPSLKDPDEAFTRGIICNWWWTVGTITPEASAAKLSERNLDWHLNHYDKIDPDTGQIFSKNTPFISLTAGVVERDVFVQRNIVFDPLITALQFATKDFTAVGCVYYAYVFTLGRQSITLHEFAEEVRELNIYKTFMPFHPEGEITAKIIVRGAQIEKWEQYDGPAAAREIAAGRVPSPTATRFNPMYAAPERYCNIRGLVTA